MFNTAAPQSQPNPPATTENGSIETKDANGTTVFIPQSVRNSLNYRAQQVLNKLETRRKQDALREREADEANEDTEEEIQERRQAEQEIERQKRADEKHRKAEEAVQNLQSEEQARQFQESVVKKAAEKSQQEPAPKQDKGNYGRTAQTVTDSKKKYPVRYKVVEAENLSTSHMIDGLGVVPNDNYKGIQPRDRVRIDQQAQILNTANRFDPDLALDTAMSVNDGAPIILNDGTVLNGNRRAMAAIYN